MIDPQRNTPLPDWLEQAWLQRYLDRELSPPEIEWFETYAIDKPALIDAIEADNTLRDALHAWYAQEQRAAATRPPASIGQAPATPTTTRHRRMSPRWLRPLAAAASLAVAAVFGAGASRWLASDDGMTAAIPAVSSPRRVVFDSLRGTNGDAPQVEPARVGADPLLIDIAVPAQAEAVAAHFADGTVLPLVVSDDGFVSLVGRPEQLQRLTPIRLSYTVNGVASERPLDISSALKPQVR